MASALSSTYVLLGKATLSQPPDWSTAVGAIHTLNSLLLCSNCKVNIGLCPPYHANPKDSFSLLCDNCQTNDQESAPSSASEDLLNILIENIRNLCSYLLRAFINVPKIEDDDSGDESEVNDQVVVVPPTHTSQAKFVSKLRKFAKNHFNLEQEEVTEVVTAPSTPKAVIVTTPNTSPKSPSSGQWIKVHHGQGKRRSSSSHVMINGNKIGRDQIVKTTLRPSLNYSTNNKSGSSNDSSNVSYKLNDFVVKLEELPTAKVTLTDIGRKSCRCGNATPTPGKLTCGGQRCPCYVSSKSCRDCKCKGCRNPHQANGVKVIRPHLQVKSLANASNSQKKYYISTSGNSLVSQNSMTTIRRIHLN